MRMGKKRGAFTLVELLVVVALIAVLVSLTAVAAFRLIGVQQSGNTAAELTKLHGELLKVYRAETDKFAQEWKSLRTSNPAATQPYMAIAGGDEGRGRVVYIKLRQRQTFPQTFNEALNAGPMMAGYTPLPPDPYYASVLTQAGYNGTQAAQPWESAVLLLLALGRGVDGNGVKPEDLGLSSCVHDFQGPAGTQPLKGLVDGWGRPVSFCRWPTGSTLLNPGGPQPKDNNDPADPSGLLESASWPAADSAWFTANLHALGSPPGASDATSYRLYPLIVSAGPDGVLGLDPATFAPLGTGAADNLYPTDAPPK